jgi:glycosyltransferase involved in cell wall biosynthesis
MKRVCIVTPSHVSFQPRALREADALHEAGYAVRVVSVRTDASLDEYDAELRRSRGWRMDGVDLTSASATRVRRLFASARLKAAQRMIASGIAARRVAAHAAVKGAGALAALACAEPADLFIAHTQATLEAAHAAAERFGAPLAFDCEDLLGEGTTSEAVAMRTLETAHIGACEYVSVPSRAMGARLASRYPLAGRLIVLENVPEVVPASLVPPRERPRAAALRVHWFGQTVGLDRGLADVAQAIRSMRHPAELHIVGLAQPEVQRALWEIAGPAGSRVFFYARVAPEHLLSTVARFDVGVAGERPDHPSYGVTLTNKIFGYLAAGLAIAATDTPGQRELLNECADAGVVYRFGDANGLARALDAWAQDRAALLRAQEAAWQAARRRYSWDVVRRRFLERVEALIGPRARAVAR